MILVNIGTRFQAFGKQVQGLYCPRNGRREKRSTQATAPGQIGRGKAERHTSRVRRPDRERLPTTSGVGDDAREVCMLRFMAGVLAALVAAPSAAQDDAVIVTATRFPDSKRDLPVGVTVITADDIRKSATS